MSHGWINSAPGGAHARCGGPGLCAACATEQCAKCNKIGTACFITVNIAGVNSSIHPCLSQISDQPAPVNEDADSIVTEILDWVKPSGKDELGAMLERLVAALR